MAKYIPTDWKDEIVDGAGNVVQKGTPLSAANLKKLEAGVEGAVAGVMGKVDGAVFDQFKTTTTTALAEKAKNTLTTTKEKMFTGQITKIVASGDSMTLGSVPAGTVGGDPYPVTLQKLLRAVYGNTNITVTNKGIGGRQTDGALASFDADVLSLNPDLVIIMYGINDARDIGDPDLVDIVTITEYKANLEAMIKKAKKANVEVLLLSPTPTLEVVSGRNKELMLYNQACIEVAKVNNIPYVDMHEEFYELFTSGAVSQSYLIADNIHFRDYGHIANAVSKHLMYSGKVGSFHVNKELKLPVYRSPYVITDLVEGKAFIGADKTKGTYFLSSNSNGGTFLRFSFYVDKPNMDCIVSFLRYPNGGIMTVLVDGVSSITINSYNPESMISDSEITLLENMAIGNHTIEFLSSNLLKGSSVDPVSGAFHLQDFIFKATKTKTPNVLFSQNANQILGSVTDFKKANQGKIRYTADGSELKGVILFNSDKVELKTNKKLIIEAEIKFPTTGAAFTWFGSKLINSTSLAKVNSGYGFFLGGTVQKWEFMRYGLNNVYASLATQPITIDMSLFHTIRIEITDVGVYTILLDGVALVSNLAVPVHNISGYFGLWAGGIGTTEIKTIEYCYI